MTGKEMEISLRIAGYMSPETTAAFKNATKSLGTLGLAGTETARKLAGLSSLRKNQEVLNLQAEKLRGALKKLNNAEYNLAEGHGKSEKAQAKLSMRLAEARAQYARQLKAVQECSKANVEHKKSVEAQFGSIRKLIREEEHLCKQQKILSNLKEHEDAIGRQVKARDDQMLGAELRIKAAERIARVMRTPFNAAMRAEQMGFELGTVLNAPEAGKLEAMRRAKETAEALAKTGVATYAEAMEAQYALNSAGLSAVLASSATKTVAAVAKITKGGLGQVGEVLATAYNNLGDRIAGSAEQKFLRLGELLTKVQFKYRIRDFSQLGESMKYASVGVSQYNVSLEQSLAAIGMLNTAGLQGGQAGTAFNAMLKGFYKFAKNMPDILVKDKDGALDLAVSIAKLRQGTDKMSDVQRATFLTEIFGDEGARAISPLLRRQRELAEGYKEVKDASKGLVDEKTAELLTLTTVKMQALRETAMLLALKAGDQLLPWAAKCIETATKAADVIGGSS